VQGVEAIIPMKCKITSLILPIELLPNKTIEEEFLVFLERLDDHYRDPENMNEAYKKCVNDQYDKKIHP
jgi:hypothetical protein